MDGHDWDLQAVVRGCRLSGPPAGTRDPFSFFHSSHLKAEEPADVKESDLHQRFPDLLSVRTTLPELEELCSPFFPKPKPHSQRQPLLTLHRTTSSSPSVASCAVAGPHRPRQPHRPLSQISRSKRRKNQQKRVVSHVPADGVSADMWAWRKYGQKPIKGSPYPRGYYKCSSSKGCPARKQVERSRTDPAMLVITYTEEHNHPLPSHRSSLAGITRDKLPSSSSPTQPPTAPSTSAPCGGGEGYQTPRENPSYSPASTAAALSPTTSLTASMEDELLLRPPSRPFKGGEEEEEEEDDEGGMLLVEDMEVMGEDDLVFMGMADLGGPTSVTAGSAFFDGDDGGFDSHFFPPPWLARNNNAAAAADGS